METTHAFIQKIASNSPTSIRITKKIALAAAMEGFGNLFPCEAELMQGLVHTGETREGIVSFLKKKKPIFNSQEDPDGNRQISGNPENGAHGDC